MYPKKFILSFLLTACCLAARGQDGYRTGLLPQINLNFSLPQEWKLNAKLESRIIWSEGVFNADGDNRDRYERTDFALVFSRKVNFNSSLGGGYQIRIQDDQVIHRLIQQFSIVTQLETFRLGHRFSTDQSFRKNNPAEFRFRYRIGLERALSGLTVDPGELYLKINHEYLLSVEGGTTDLEARLVPVTGLNITNNNKLESGLDYRVSGLVNGQANHQFWWYLGWFFSL